MLIKNHILLEKEATVTLTKYINGKKTVFGAFPESSNISFSISLSRSLGASGVVLRLNKDGKDCADIPFTFIGESLSQDRYEVSINEKTGLYFYEILLLRGNQTLFLSSINNHDFILREGSGKKFSLLFYKKDFSTPKWVKGGIIYHIFVDRFCRGKGECFLHSGEINEDWDNGTPQFAESVGDSLSNDVFFGGNLWGVVEKLDYLKSLGVTIIYLSPIFEARSNHRYDTGDYEKIDSLLGGIKAFDTLVKKAHEKGIKIILDGVFNHTGNDSKYFNAFGTYDTIGACQSESSPYFEWYNFTQFPIAYESWWGIKIMPRLMHENPSCRSYFTGKNGIIEHWLKSGADGWRLDVADELCDEFLVELNMRAKSTKDSFVIGEVWENAVLKTAYGKRRRYFWGNELDSVMNYPLRNAILSLLIDKDSECFYNTVTEIYSSYPEPVLHSLMNIISTHDTERITTLLGDGGEGIGKNNTELSMMRLTDEKRRHAIKMLRLASLIQFTVFGLPSIYYGDETGLEGYRDPFSRMPFPWKKRDKELFAHYTFLASLREKYDCLKSGHFRFLYHENGVVGYERKSKKDSLRIWINSQNQDIFINNMKIDGNSFKII